MRKLRQGLNSITHYSYGGGGAGTRASLCLELCLFASPYTQTTLLSSRFLLPYSTALPHFLRLLPHLRLDPQLQLWSALRINNSQPGGALTLPPLTFLSQTVLYLVLHHLPIAQAGRQGQPRHPDVQGVGAGQGELGRCTGD